jgi:hypothetical protein
MCTGKNHPLGCAVENMSVSPNKLETNSDISCGKPVLNRANRFTVLAAVLHIQHASTTKFMYFWNQP